MRDQLFTIIYGNIHINYGRYNMLETILGSVNSERVLMYLFAREEGFASEIAKYYATSLNGIQQQLEKFETGGVFLSKKYGRTRVYTFNPRYPFLDSLKNLLENALTFYSVEEQDKLLLNRRRPRRKGKPI
jgi:hypothetical protein